MPPDDANPAHIPHPLPLIVADSYAHPLPDWASLILENIDEVLFSVDREWRFTYLNRQASIAWGQPPAALLGQVMWEAFPALLDTPFEEVYRQAMADGRPGRLESFSHVTRAWYDVRAFPVAQGLIIAFHDSTTRKRAEATLQQQADRMRVQSEVSRVLSEVTHDYQRTLDTATHQLADIVGDGCILHLISEDGEWLEHVALHHRDPEAVAFVRDILVGSPYQRVDAGLAGRVIQTGQPVLLPNITMDQLKAMTSPRHWEYFERFAIFSALLAPLRATGRVIGVITMTRHVPDQPYTNDDQILVQDLADRVAIAITNARLLRQTQAELAERTRTEAALQISEERFKTLSAATSEAILMHEQGMLIEVNERAVALFGYPRDELLRMSIEDLIAPEQLSALRKRIAENSQEAAESIGVRKDGTRFITESRGRQIAYQGKRVLLVAIRDITDLKQAEATLRTTQAQLLQAQKMESIGQLAGGIAHDFNNLLSVIVGYCDLIINGLSEADPLYTDLREIQQAGNRAATLVRQILAFSRQQILEPQVINLNATVANLDTLLHRVLGADIDVLTLLDPQLAPTLVDPGQMEQVIVNLAVNARDAMPDGGHLTIETANVELDQHYRSAGHPDVKTGAYVMIAVSDTGMGMDQATQDKIFEPFFTTKEPGKGTGLGLATVYGIVRQSEGTIWVYSELGIGTTFKIYLPIVADQSLEISQAVSDPRLHRSMAVGDIDRPGHGRTILVVEDDVFVRDLIQRVLSEAGYTVLEANQGQAALEIITTTAAAVDLVLTDMVMPGMGGRALVDRLKEHWAELPILCMSGYTDHTVQRHHILRPCDAFLQKPFTPAALLRRIADILHPAGGD